MSKNEMLELFAAHSLRIERCETTEIQQKLNNCVWPVLPAKVWSEMLQELEKFDLTVSYPDPVTNTWTTRRMYPGDRSAEPYFVGTNGIPTLYINCTCNLIDRGEDGT